MGIATERLRLRRRHLWRIAIGTIAVLIGAALAVYWLSLELGSVAMAFALAAIVFVNLAPLLSEHRSPHDHG